MVKALGPDACQLTISAEVKFTKWVPGIASIIRSSAKQARVSFLAHSLTGGGLFPLLAVCYCLQAYEIASPPSSDPAQVH